MYSFIFLTIILIILSNITRLNSINKHKYLSSSLYDIGLTIGINYLLEAIDTPWIEIKSTLSTPMKDVSYDLLLGMRGCYNEICKQLEEADRKDEERRISGDLKKDGNQITIEKDNEDLLFNQIYSTIFFYIEDYLVKKILHSTTSSFTDSLPDTFSDSLSPPKDSFNPLLSSSNYIEDPSDNTLSSFIDEINKNISGKKKEIDMEREKDSYLIINSASPTQIPTSIPINSSSSSINPVGPPINPIYPPSTHNHPTITPISSTTSPRLKPTTPLPTQINPKSLTNHPTSLPLSKNFILNNTKNNKNDIKKLKIFYNKTIKNYFKLLRFLLLFYYFIILYFLFFIYSLIFLRLSNFFLLFSSFNSTSNTSLSTSSSIYDSSSIASIAAAVSQSFSSPSSSSSSSFSYHNTGPQITSSSSSSSSSFNSPTFYFSSYPLHPNNISSPLFSSIPYLYKYYYLVKYFFFFFFFSLYFLFLIYYLLLKNLQHSVIIISKSPSSSLSFSSSPPLSSTLFSSLLNFVITLSYNSSMYNYSTSSNLLNLISAFSSTFSNYSSLLLTSNPISSPLLTSSDSEILLKITFSHTISSYHKGFICFLMFFFIMLLSYFGSFYFIKYVTLIYSYILFTVLFFVNLLYSLIDYVKDMCCPSLTVDRSEENTQETEANEENDENEEQNENDEEKSLLMKKINKKSYQAIE